MLTAPQALQILNCISQEHYAVVLGGDICDAHCRYLMPNWHYTPDDSFNRDENIQRSCEYARSFIQSLPYKHEVFFILVLSTDNL
ncbi:MAG: hypothetical protein IJA59_03925 [Clostridia bacterium]|nr:hypothetical protein [Clostridia bacterium]